MIAIPTLSTIIARVKGDLAGALGNANALIKGTLEWALAHAIPGAVWGLWLYQQYIAKQCVPGDDTDTEYLLRWGQIWIGGKVAAAKATGTAAVYGLIGSTLNTGAVMRRDDGLLYVVTAGPYVWAATASKDVTFQASVAGADYNLAYSAAVRLVLVSPPAGVQASNPLKAALPIAGGTDEETDASYLERIRDRIQDPPQGGSVADYEAWAQAALSVVDRVWVQRWSDVALGTVKVLFTVTGSGTGPWGTGVIPTAGNVTTVNNYIQARFPADAKEAVVAAPSGHAVTLAITYWLESGADVTAMKAAVLAGLEAMFRERAEVDASGASVANSYIHEAIGQAAGLDKYTLTAVDGGAGTADIALAANEYPTIVAGGIAWTAG